MTFIITKPLLRLWRVTAYFGSSLFTKVVVFSEGGLYMDRCDFNGNSAAVLVSVGREKPTVIRNAVLGEINCENKYFCVVLSWVVFRFVTKQHHLLDSFGFVFLVRLMCFSCSCRYDVSSGLHVWHSIVSAPTSSPFFPVIGFKRPDFLMSGQPLLRRKTVRLVAIRLLSPCALSPLLPFSHPSSSTSSLSPVYCRGTL